MRMKTTHHSNATASAVFITVRIIKKLWNQVYARLEHTYDLSKVKKIYI